MKVFCGQCEYYMGNTFMECPHQENTALDKSCEKFKYTNPEKRIDSLEAENKRLREGTDWLLEEYHFMSRKMTEINNIVQPLWGELGERRNDYQLIEKFVEQIQEKGIEQALKEKPND